MKITSYFLAISLWISFFSIQAQGLIIPNTNTNFKCMAGRTIATTDIVVKWNAPGVKGREGQIFGTNVAPYGLNVLGFGSDVESPWRAGADECTTISFSTDVKINGAYLPAGNYAYFIILDENECTLIFNKNVKEWGAYFYDQSLDVLRVKTTPQRNLPNNKERLEFVFSEQTDNSVVLALEWEHWRIPFTINIDVVGTTLASIKSQMAGGIGFDPPSLIAAANWCLNNDVNLDEAVQWLNSATDPNLGGVISFGSLSTKSALMKKLGKEDEANEIMAKAIELGTNIELHLYGRQLLNQNKIDEAMAVFEANYKKNKGAWPTNVGMMRGYSAKGDFAKAIEYAKVAVTQAPDDLNREALKAAIKMLESGKAL